MKKIFISLISILMVFSLLMPITAEDETKPMETVKQNYMILETSQYYETLIEAINAVESGQTIQLQKNIDNATGVAVPSGKDFILDFNNKIYKVIGPGAGSSGTETNVFQLLKDSTIIMKNGTIDTIENASSNNVKRIIQNYANLTLENMIINTANLGSNEDYALSFNNGNIKFSGNTSINMSSPERIAFDIYNFESYPSVKVEFTDDFTGSIGGVIMYDASEDTHSLKIDGNGSFNKVEYANQTQEEAAKSNISINSGTFKEDVSDYVKVDTLQANANSKFAVSEESAQDLIDELNTGDTLTITSSSSDTSLILKPGISVTNNSTNNITVNGTVVTSGQTSQTEVPEFSDDDTIMLTYEGINKEDFNIPDNTINESLNKAISSELLENKPLITYAEDKTIKDIVEKNIHISISKSSDVVSDDKDLIKEQLTSQGYEVNEEISQYFDLSLIINKNGVDAEKIGNLKETVNPIEFTIRELSDSIKNTKEGEELKLVRVHDGNVEIIEGDINLEDLTVTFSSDKFSTYAIVAVKKTESQQGGSTSPDHNWAYRPSYNDSKDEEVKEYTTAEKSKACIELLGKGWEYSESNKSCVYTLDSNTQQIPNTSTR